jgi:hypothetical protein
MLVETCPKSNSIPRSEAERLVGKFHVVRAADSSVDIIRTEIQFTAMQGKSIIRRCGAVNAANDRGLIRGSIRNAVKL